MNIPSIAVFLTLLAAHPSLSAVIVAVASSVVEPVEEISKIFESRHGIPVTMVTGSTGSLYARITQGAPYEVFLAADGIYPALLEKKGLVKERFPYAHGTLAVWTKKKIEKKELSFLKDRSVRRIAIANPSTAPYGRAAVEAMKRYEVYEEIKNKLVYGETVAQALGFARTANADAAIVAAALVLGIDGDSFEVKGEPIVHDAVLMKGGSVESAMFMDFLKTKETVEIFKKYGYKIP